MTPAERLAEIEQRWNNTPDSPWHLFINDISDAKGNFVAECADEQTAAFVYHSDDDIPWLLARVRQLEAALTHFSNKGDYPVYSNGPLLGGGEIARQALNTMPEVEP